MENLTTMFATFVVFVSGVIFITDSVNKLFKIEGQTAKLLMSWGMSIALAALGFGLQLGFFADCGTPDQWQGWVKAILIGIGGAISANKIYNREEIWKLLEIIFSFFKKDGKAIRARLRAKENN